MSWDFLSPGRLWLLVLLPALAGAYLLAIRNRARNTMRFTQIDLLDDIAPRRPGWRRHVVTGLQLLALGIIIVAVAQPVRRSIDRPTSEGRIIMLFDVSLSMEAEDVQPNRFAAAQEAASVFVDEVDPEVQIGLISFAGTTATEVALTDNRITVQDGIVALQLDLGTAIGDALASGTRTLVRAGDDSDGGDGTAPGVIVLLTDGETTVGRPTSEGAREAAEAGIPVYTIAFGTPDGTIVDPETGDTVPVPVKLDELAQVAELTGGEAFAAPTAGDLRDAYAAISEQLDVTIGQPEEIVVELTWRYALTAALVFVVAWLLGLWWLRGPL
jgi:Ca-activated chloride channel family protein